MSITERIDATTYIPEEYQAKHIPAPKSAKIELTGRCNFSCSFCARSLKLRDQKDMNKKFFKRIVRELRESGVEELGLFYIGESFLCNWLEDAIYFAKHVAKFPYVFLTTNGSMATPDRVKKCMENGLDSLKWSLNYSDAEQFVEIARVKESLYDDMMDNLFHARQARDQVEQETGHRCGLYASYIQYNGEQGEKMSGTVESVSDAVDEIYALPLYSQSGPQDSPLPDEYKPTPGNPGRADCRRDPLPCWSVSREAHVTWNGLLSACCWDNSEGLIMADLNKVSFMDGWNGLLFQKLRKAHLGKDVSGTACEKCVNANL